MKPYKNVTKRMIMAVKYFVGEAKFNKSLSMKMAGYADKMANAHCTEFYNDPLVKKLVEDEMKELVETAHVSAEFLIHSMLKIVNYGIKPRHIKKTIYKKDGSVENIEWDEEVQDPRAATEAAKLLSQCLPDFKERKEVTVEEKEIFEIGGKQYEF